MSDGLIVIIILSFFLICLIICSTVYTLNDKFVREHSELYQNILKVNKLYQFHENLENEFVLKKELSSKRAYNYFSFDNCIEEYMDNRLDYYENLFAQLSENKANYQSYIEEYKKIEKYATKEYVDELKFNYRTFNRHEQRLYKQGVKQKPIISHSIKIIAEYTSPAGRNSYSMDQSYSYFQIIEIFTKVKENRKMQKVILEYKRISKEKAEARKREMEERKKAKEKEYRENLKRLKDLDKREAELKRKEEEFINATKGHIYSSSENLSKEQISNDVFDDGWYKLTTLKKAYENGEISNEEYEKKRKEILEE